MNSSTNGARQDRGALGFDDLRRLGGNRAGPVDVACPLCGPDRSRPANRVRPVLRIWNVSPTFSTFYCARCEARGDASDGSGARIDPVALRRAREQAAARDRQVVADRLVTSRALWRMRRPLAGSVGERYMREVRSCGGSLPPTLGFLPARGEHPPAMIAAFGIPDEPEPGVMVLRDNAVRGVHLTKLLPDGSGKAGDPSKIIIGRCPGTPIVLALMTDSLGLVITEGIEDGASVHEATGIGTWVAGAAPRMPALAETVPGYVDTITVIGDADPVGQRNAYALRDGLRKRNLHAAVVTLRAPMVAA